MDLTSGQPYWLAKNGHTKHELRLKEDVETEVLVIGGGITGALVLYYLTRAGLPAVLVDKHRFGAGSTSASTALLQYQVDVPLSKMQEMIGEADANLAYKHCAFAVDELKRVAKEIGYSGLKSRPTLFKASDKNGAKLIEREFELHAALNLNVSLMTGSEIHEKFGFKAPCALWSEHSAETDAYQLMNELLNWSVARGARVHQLTEIDKLNTKKSGIEALTSDKNIIQAKYTVYASGYAIDEKLYRNIVSLNTTFAYVTKPTEQEENWFRNSLIWETKEPYHYMRSADNGSIIVGGGDIKGNDPRRRERLLDRKVAEIRKHFLRMFPKLDQEIEYRWAGTFGGTKDGLPYIGTMGSEHRIFYALGFGGNGITFSTLAGKLIAEEIQGIKSEEARLYRFDR